MARGNQQTAAATAQPAQQWRRGRPPAAGAICQRGGRSPSAAAALAEPNSAIACVGSGMEVMYDARSVAHRTESLHERLEAHPHLGKALRDCAMRFVSTLSEEHLRDAARLCFELQEAYWFYLDNLYEESKNELPKLNQTSFMHLMLEASSVLVAIYSTPQARHRVLQEWREYYKGVPLRGAVLLNTHLDRCLMVQPWKSDKWTFPRGKMNEKESEVDCTVREVREETGVDIAGRVDAQHFVQALLPGRTDPVKLFLVPDMPKELPCAPTTRREISKIAWVELIHLPGWRSGVSEEASGLRFQYVEPFVGELQRWVATRQLALVLGGPAAALGASLAPPRPARAAEVAVPARPAAAPVAGLAERPAASFHIDGARVREEFDRGWALRAEAAGSR